MVVTILDYGVGNLHSLAKAFGRAGADVRIEPCPRRALSTDALVLPGVGAFSVAAQHIADDRDLVRDAIDAGLPTLGICLGMQLLFDDSEEGEGRGLSVIAGRVERLKAQRTPQIGWNTVRTASDRSIVGDNAAMYFANTYVCRPASEDVVTDWATYESDRFAAAVRAGSAVGVQFHPEKSSRVGIETIERFLAEASR